MKQTDVKFTPSADRVPAEQVTKEFEDEVVKWEPAAKEALEAALDVLGNEIVRRKVLARRAGDAFTANLLAVALNALAFAEGVLDEDVLPNDQLFNALILRDELAELPPPDPDKDDPWILRSDSDAPKPADDPN